MKHAFALIIALLLTGCGSTEITSRKDSFTGATILTTDVLPLKRYPEPKPNYNGDPSDPNADTSLTFEKVVISGRPVTYSIKFDEDLLNEIQKAVSFGGPDSLLIKLDGGEILKLSTKGKSVFYHDIPETVIKKILNSKSALVRLKSSTYNYDGYISGKIKTALDNLYKGKEIAKPKAGQS